MNATATRNTTTRGEGPVTLETVQDHARRIRENLDPEVRPGLPAAFTAACTPGDTIAQGDLYIELVERVPEGYALVANPQPADLKLVPGDTVGSNHCLDSFAGVQLYRPVPWTGEDLRGPCLVVAAERTITHNKGDQQGHGPVTLVPGVYLCGYQPEQDHIARRERRNAD